MINVLKKAVFAGAEQLKYYFDKEFTIGYKEGGNNNLVTEADKASEAAIINVLQQAYPTHHFLTEETGKIIGTGDGEYQWIIDPLDGTINFAHKIPICAVSIGLEKNNHIVAGAVYNPFMEELFFAEKNNGATLNNKKITVSKTTAVEKACIATGFPYIYNEAPYGPLTIFPKFIKKGIPMRRLGAAAIDLCWVADGRFDAFYEHHLYAWDSAAGFLIVTEAGGKVTTITGDAFSPHQHQIAATNGLIHEELLTYLN